MMKQVLFASISKKFVMALAGLFLLTFLPVHLGINLLLLKGDPEPFNKAAHFMSTFPPVKIMEIVLIAALLIHIIYGLIIQIQNWIARPVGYLTRQKTEISFFSRFMIWTGGTIFIFLLIHFFNFFFIKIGLVQGDPENFYNTAHQLFQITSYNIFYLICFLLLGLHLYHAFWSVFQTLGLNHRIWTPIIKVLSVIYAIVIPAGFASIPIIIWLF